MPDTPTFLDGYDGVRRAIGRELGCSPWLDIDQSRIDLFAEVTGDHAWIHVDPIRATAGPYGGPIAHGLLTLSAITMLAGQAFRVTGLTNALHYGYDRVRFIQPVRVGSSIRARVSLVRLDSPPEHARASFRVVVEVADLAGPALAADLIYFYDFGASDAALVGPTTREH